MDSDQDYQERDSSFATFVTHHRYYYSITYYYIIHPINFHFFFIPTIFSSLEFFKYVDQIERATYWFNSELSEKENLSTKNFLSSIAIFVPILIPFPFPH